MVIGGRHMIGPILDPIFCSAEAIIVELAAEASPTMMERLLNDQQ